MFLPVNHPKIAGLLLAAIALTTPCVHGDETEHPGIKHFDDAIRTKINAVSLQDLNKTIDHLQKALDLGLDAEDTEFAELMLSDTLMQRATSFMRVVTAESIKDRRVQQIVRQVISDLRRVHTYKDPPPDAFYVLGKLMGMPGGDPHEAKRLLSKYLEFEEIPKDKQVDAIFLRARVQTEESLALKDYAKALELDPDNHKIRLVRAAYLKSRKKLEDALADIDTVLGTSPKDANALMLQGETLQEIGDLRAALQSYAEASQLAPKSPLPYQKRGEVFRILGDSDKALQEFDKVLQINPDDMRSLVHRSEIYLRQGRLEEGLQDVDKVLLQQPMLVVARQIRAELLANMKRLPEAIAEIQRLADSSEGSDELKLQLALYYQLDRQLGRAIGIYTSLLQKDPTNAELLRSRGDAYLSLGNHAEAIADFEAALNQMPDDSPLLNNLAWVLATSPDDQLRDGKRAVELATKACELTEYKLPHILSTLAAAFAESGDFDTAIEWSEKAVALDDTEQEEQLSKELSSYRGGQPWRERQTLDVKTEETDEGLPANSAEE